MAHVTKGKVLESGTGNTTISFTLAGAITGFRTFLNAPMSVNDTCFYSAYEVDANGNPTGEFENGLGTLTAGTTLTRTTVFESSTGSPVTFSGTLWIGLTLLANKTLQLDDIDASTWPVALSEPPNSSANTAKLFAKNVIAGNTEFWRKDESGKAVPLQDSWAFTRIQKYQSSNNNIAAIGSSALTTVGTLGATTPATGSAKNNIRRTQIASAASVGAFASAYTNTTSGCPVYRGGANGEGGFRWVMKFALQGLIAGNRGYFGLFDVVTAPANVNPTTNTTPGKVGIGFDTNTGNWKLINNVTGTAPTVLDLGNNFPLDTTSLIELIIFVAPFNGTAQPYKVKISRYTTDPRTPEFSREEVLSANIPAQATLMHPALWMTNNATAAAVFWHFADMTLESDN